MCSGTILLFGISRVIIGENKSYMGDEERLRDAGVEVTVLDDTPSYELMQKFIEEKPTLWNEDIGV